MGYVLFQYWARSNFQRVIFHILFYRYSSFYAIHFKPPILSLRMPITQKQYGYTVQYEKEYVAQYYHIPQELHDQFPALEADASNAETEGIIPKLVALVSEYPHIPQLKNFLSTAYFVRGQEQKAYEVNQQNEAEHPDYIFAKLNRAYKALNEGKPEFVPGILHPDLDIKALYPDRDTFYIGELLAYHLCVVTYLCKTGDLELAEKHNKLLWEIGRGYPETWQASKMLEEYKMALWIKLKEESRRYFVDGERPLPEQVNEAPVYHHPEYVAQLFLLDECVYDKFLKEILALPRKTLIADMRNILKDTLHRHESYLTEYGNIAAMHAALILMELKDRESFPILLDYIQYDDDFIAFHMGRYFTETLWSILYTLGRDYIPQMGEFLKEPGINVYSKCAVADALAQIAVHEPKKRPAVLNVFRGYLEKILSSREEDNLWSSELHGLLMGALYEGGFIELIPLCRQMHHENLVDVSIHGLWVETLEEFERLGRKGLKHKIRNIFEMYERLRRMNAKSEFRNDLHEEYEYLGEDEGDDEE